jgi:HCOMODA/2-hydroxy-3-carboxy-muconic semialdehyde decarboxylase
VEQVASTLTKRGIDVTNRIYPGLGHETRTITFYRQDLGSRVSAAVWSWTAMNRAGVASGSESTRGPSSLLHDLVLANRILANEGVLDAFGHVSLRHPDDPTRFVISRSLGPVLVTESDLQIWTVVTNEQVGGHSGTAYAERAIHAAVYAARADVGAVCHNHSPSTIPFGVTGVPLRPVFHMAGFLGSDTPVWEPSAEFGDTDMLVRSVDQGRSLARTLGHRRVALMRGHGTVVVGATLQEVVFQCVYMEINARLQMQAMSLSQDVRYLSEGEVAATADWQCSTVALERAWHTWAGRLGFRGLHPLETPPLSLDR